MPPPNANRRLDLAVYSLALIGSVRLAWLMLRDGGVARAGPFATALALGWVFVRAEFGYTAGFRQLLRTGKGSPLAVGVIVASVAALVVVP